MTLSFKKQTISLPSVPGGRPPAVKVGWRQESKTFPVAAGDKTVEIETPEGVDYAIIFGDVRQTIPAGGLSSKVVAKFPVVEGKKGKASDAGN